MDRSICWAPISASTSRNGATIGSPEWPRARWRSRWSARCCRYSSSSGWPATKLRQTLVTIGISIVAADLMLAIWGGKTYQFSIPEWLDGSIATPIITAVKSNGQIVTMRYPLYRLVVLGAAAVIGVGLWLTLNKTRLGMMIRAGVDDRAMLSAAGVNVRTLFVAVFAIGRRLAGFSGVIGGSALVGRARRGRALSPGLARRRHRRRHGLDYRGGDRRAADWPSPNRSASFISRPTASCSPSSSWW